MPSQETFREVQTSFKAEMMGKNEILCSGQKKTTKQNKTKNPSKNMGSIHLLEEAGTKCSVVLPLDFGIF